MVERQKAIFNVPTSVGILFWHSMNRCLHGPQVGRCALLINVFCTQEFSKFQKFQKAGFADVSIGFGGARYPTNGEGNLGEYVGEYDQTRISY